MIDVGIYVLFFAKMNVIINTFVSVEQRCMCHFQQINTAKDYLYYFKKMQRKCLNLLINILICKYANESKAPKVMNNF